MKSRSQGAIYLGPTGNLQGTYKFFSLATGKILKRRKFTQLPMPDSVVCKVEKWGQRAMQPEEEFVFSNRNREPFPWNEMVDNETLIVAEQASFPAMPAEMPGVELERNQPTTALETPENDEQLTADRAARNANLNDEPDPGKILGILEENEPIAEEGEIEEGEIDNDDHGKDILAVGTVEHNNDAPDPIEIEDNDSKNNNTNNDDESSTEKPNQDNDSADDSSDDEDDDHDAEQITRRSKRSTKGTWQSKQYEKEYAHVSINEE